MSLQKLSILKISVLGQKYSKSMTFFFNFSQIQSSCRIMNSLDFLVLPNSKRQYYTRQQQAMAALVAIGNDSWKLDYSRIPDIGFKSVNLGRH